MAGDSAVDAEQAEAGIGNNIAAGVARNLPAIHAGDITKFF